MNCRSVSSSLSAYVDNEVGLETSEEIQHHLARCHRCRNEEQELRNLKALIGGSGCPDLDPEFEVRLQQWLKDPEKSCPPSRIVRTVSLWLLAPACAVCIWLVTESVSVTPISRSTPTMSVAGNLARDQVYDLTANQPEYGAPVITAVDYAP